MTETDLYNRITEAENRFRQARFNPAPTVPQYGLGAPAKNETSVELPPPPPGGGDGGGGVIIGGGVGGPGVIFDGRASNMTTLYSTSPPLVLPPVQAQDPNIWDCLCFTNSDIQLVSDSRYGKMFYCEVPIGDTNPWGGSTGGNINGAGQISNRRIDTSGARTNELGEWAYFAFGIRIPSWINPPDTFFASIFSFGYQTSSGDQLAIGLHADSSGTLYYTSRGNVGNAQPNYPNSINYAIGDSYHEDYVLPVTYGQTEEFIYAVKWATDNTGQLEIYHRTPPSGTWNVIFTRPNAPTYLYGDTQNGHFDPAGGWTVIDKMGLYWGTYSHTIYTQAYYLSGYTRSSNLAAAQSTLPA